MIFSDLEEFEPQVPSAADCQEESADEGLNTVYCIHSIYRTRFIMSS